MDDVTIVAGVEINRGIKSEVLGRTSLLSFVTILIIVLVIIIIVVVISYELRDWPQINEGNSRNLSLCKTRCFVIQFFILTCSKHLSIETHQSLWYWLQLCEFETTEANKNPDDYNTLLHKSNTDRLEGLRGEDILFRTENDGVESDVWGEVGPQPFMVT